MMSNIHKNRLATIRFVKDRAKKSEFKQWVHYLANLVQRQQYIEERKQMDDYKLPNSCLTDWGVITNVERPLLGLTPRNIAENEYKVKRTKDIVEAIGSYTEANKPIPKEWFEEYNELNKDNV